MPHESQGTVYVDILQFSCYFVSFLKGLFVIISWLQYFILSSLARSWAFDFRFYVCFHNFVNSHLLNSVFTVHTLPLLIEFSLISHVPIPPLLPPSSSACQEWRHSVPWLAENYETNAALRVAARLVVVAVAVAFYWCAFLFILLCGAWIVIVILYEFGCFFMDERYFSINFS